ncbi:MAG: hypothetical protein Q8Q14_10925, partial [Gemmatimonadales bacterium]|nr:hypothetical protein [Gemmatimonadales bacterium]
MSFEAAARGEEAQLMEWTLARALVMQLRELVTTEDDGPEGAMGPAWILAQVREMLGPAPESDALRAEIAR